jgi:hypothetical protein
VTLHCWVIGARCFGTTWYRNVRDQSPSNASPYCRRSETSTARPPNRKISQVCISYEWLLLFISESLAFCFAIQKLKVKNMHNYSVCSCWAWVAVTLRPEGSLTVIKCVLRTVITAVHSTRFIMNTYFQDRLRVFENRVLREIFGPERAKVTGSWRKLHNELCDLHCLSELLRSSNTEGLRLVENSHWVERWDMYITLVNVIMDFWLRWEVGNVLAGRITRYLLKELLSSPGFHSLFDSIN